MGPLTAAVAYSAFYHIIAALASGSELPSLLLQAGKDPRTNRRPDSTRRRVPNRHELMALKCDGAIGDASGQIPQEGHEGLSNGKHGTAAYAS
jgi:hypothetical protein